MTKSNSPAQGDTPQHREQSLRLVLQIEAPRRRILSTALGESMVLGRADEAEQRQPDIDLSPAGAREAGVSRLHACVHYKADTLFIEDLGSTNGTRINGVDLTAGKNYRLMSGDEIELGSLRMTARIVRGP